LEHVLTGTLALDILTKLPASELPDIVLIAFRLPVLTALDFIRLMYSHPQLSSIVIFVCGPAIRREDIEELYRAGAACVFVGTIDSMHLDALRQFCRNRVTSLGNGAEPTLQSRCTANSARTSSQEVRNARLGTMFLLTGGISIALWLFALVGSGESNTMSFLPTS